MLFQLCNLASNGRLSLSSRSRATAENEPVSTTRTRTPSAPGQIHRFPRKEIRTNHSKKGWIIVPRQEAYFKTAAGNGHF